jgi:SAM-dependent methyltransferase
MKIIKKRFQNLYDKAVEMNRQNIFSLLGCDGRAEFLDLGCDDGALTIELAEEINTYKVYGVEIVPERIRLAEEKAIKVKSFDLNHKFVFDDGSFDVVHANQVIEHLYDSDNFLAEIYRVLRPGGYAIISTENASSWCNIFAGIMGWQIFSLTNFSSRRQGIGNPLALHRDNNPNLASWNHIRIYNIRGLKEYFEIFGFRVAKILGAGYFPLPASLADFDKNHCHFMTFKIEKPRSLD